MSGAHRTRQKSKEDEHVQLVSLFKELIDAQAKTTEALVKLRKETKKGNARLAEIKVTAESMDETLLDIYEAKEKKRAKFEASTEQAAAVVALRQSMVEEAKDVLF